MHGIEDPERRLARGIQNFQHMRNTVVGFGNSFYAWILPPSEMKSLYGSITSSAVMSLSYIGVFTAVLSFDADNAFQCSLVQGRIVPLRKNLSHPPGGPHQCRLRSPIPQPIGLGDTRAKRLNVSLGSKIGSHASSNEVRFTPERSTGQCNTACSLSAGVRKPKVFRGR